MNKSSGLLSLLTVLSFICLPYSFSAEIAVKDTSQSKSLTATTSAKQISTPAQSDTAKSGVEFFAYNTRTDNQQNNETGTRDCSGRSEDQDYSDCRNGAEDTNIDDATETHRLKTRFLSEQWIVSGIKTQSPAYSATKQAVSTQKTVNQKLDPRYS